MTVFGAHRHRSAPKQNHVSYRAAEGGGAVICCFTSEWQGSGLPYAPCMQGLTAVC